MLDVVLWALLAIVVAGGLCALAVVFLPAGEQIAPALRDEPVWALPPERALEADDVDSVRLPVALRGYRFAETDLLLDRLAAEIRSRDLTIARLNGATTFQTLPQDHPEPDPVAPAEDVAELTDEPLPTEGFSPQPAADPVLHDDDARD